IVTDRGATPVDVLVMNLVFVAEMERGPLAQLESESRVDAITLKPRKIAKRLRVFIHRIEPERGVRRYCLTDIRGTAGAAPASKLNRAFIDRNAVGALRHAVDHATATAATEDHRIGAFEHLD